MSDELEQADIDEVEAAATDEVESGEDETPEGADDADTKDGEPKAKEEDEDDKLPKGVKKRIDTLTRQRYEREARIADLERQISEISQKQQAATPEPQLDQFDTFDAYVDALADHKAKAKVSEHQKAATVQQEQVAAVDSFKQRATEFAKGVEDYDQAFVVAAQLPIAPETALAMVNHEIGPQVAYYLGKNPNEGYRLATLSPAMQLMELGTIIAKLKTAPPVKRVSQAPAPAKTVQSASKSTKSDDEISTKEWMDKRSKQVHKK